MIQECGCEITYDIAGYGGMNDMSNYHNWRIEYCPTHAAAFDLLTLCQQAHRALASNIKDGPIPSDSTYLSVMVERLEKAIAQVKKVACL